MLDIKIDMTSRSFDKSSYNNSAKDFIPIACHYNENTLLTKNGELIQIIQIKGVNSEKISEKLFDVRKILHNSIKNNIENSRCAFWIHTIRSQTNLDDKAPYDNLLSSYIHEVWKTKNYWDNKFVNTLYISIVHDSAKIHIKNLGSFVNSMFFNVLTSNFHDKYLEKASIDINNLTNKILLDLTDLESEKLAIRYDNEKITSDLMSLYYRVIHMKEQECELPVADLSADLGLVKYTINSNVIESKTNDQKKYASIISLKEYPDIQPEAFDEILQLPIEIIATEIFYFAAQKEIMSNFKDYHYIVSITKDANLTSALKLDEIVNIKNSENNKFCYQQISMIIISDNEKNLQASLIQMSKLLSNIGVQHVREDINLEQSFWACLPGNFMFLKRMTPTFAENVGALASLHNFPTGKQSSAWGRAITLLRTEKGTPYFLNFHDKNDKANCYIFGTEETGKTTLTNFLISESTKYNPSIIYITPNNDSKIFINGLGGEWIEKETQIINPFLIDKNIESENFIYEFLKIISNHYIVELTDIELEFLKSLKDQIFKLKKEKRIFSDILKNTDFSSEAGKILQEKLKYFMEDGIYYKLFDENKLLFTNNKIIGLNLNEFSQTYFTEKYYPKERKYLDQFKENFNKNTSITTGLIYAINYHFNLAYNKNKILVLDDLHLFIKLDMFQTILNQIHIDLQKNFGILLCNANFQDISHNKNSQFQLLLKNITTKITMPSNVQLISNYNNLGLNNLEITRLSKFSINSRAFLFTQNQESIILELSISGFTNIVRILLSKENDIEIWNKIIEEYPGEPTNWLAHLYNKFDVE